MNYFDRRYCFNQVASDNGKTRAKVYNSHREIQERWTV